MNAKSVWAVGLLGVLASCGGGRSLGETAWSSVPTVTPVAPAASVTAPDAARTQAVVLVALDGVRWQEIFGGVDPTLARKAGLASDEVVAADALLPGIYERMVRRGAALGAPGHGEPVWASGPNYISLPGYREMLSGAPDERCTSNDCPTTDRVTIVDRVRAVSARDEDVAVISSWDIIERAATAHPEQVVVSTGRTEGKSRHKVRVSERSAQLMDDGERSSAWPGHDGYRPDRITAPLALEYLEAARPRFLFVGLGDPDEFAHASDYRGYLDSLRAADRFVVSLFDTLGRMGEQGAATTVLLTTDHGRSASFHSHGRTSESSRVFILAAGGAVPALGYVPAGPNRTLSSITPTIAGLLGLGSGAGALDEPWREAGAAAPWSPAPLAATAERLVQR